MLLAIQRSFNLSKFTFGIPAQHHARMCQLPGIGMRTGYDDWCAQVRDCEELCGEVERQSNTAMGGRITRQVSGMERDA